MKRLFFVVVSLFFYVSVFGSNYNIGRTDNLSSHEDVFHNRWNSSIRGDSLDCRLVGRALFGASHSVFVKDTIAYACHGNSLLILNLKNPSSPILVGFYDTGDYAYGVYVKDTIAYVADGNDGLRIIDVAAPSNPTEIGFYDTGDYAEGVYVKDTIAYVADGNDGLYLIHYYGNTGIKENKNKNKNKNNVYDISVKMQDGLSINYSLSETKHVAIDIYNIAGQKLYGNNSTKSPGQYSIRWNGNRGVYFIKIDIDKYSYTKKAIIIK